MRPLARTEVLKGEVVFLNTSCVPSDYCVGPVIIYSSI